MTDRSPVERLARMVCFEDAADRFQMRAAGIAIRNGRVLVQNLVGEKRVSLPGGRIDQRESSVAALVREMDEEFACPVEVGPLAFVLESFFTDLGRRFHEVGFYFPMMVPGHFPYHDNDVCHRHRDGGAQMEYRWIQATPESLAAAQLVPETLRARLPRLPTSVVHLVDHRSYG